MATIFGARANRTLREVFTFIKMGWVASRESRPTMFGKSLRHQWSRTRPPPSNPFLRNKLLDVFAQQIRFEVDGISDLPFPQRSDFVGVRNNPDAKAFLLHARHRQA